MFRLFDWQCVECKERDEHLVNVPNGKTPPRKTKLWCSKQSAVTVHERLISKPAPYMGERVLNPMMFGGEFDTVGHRQGPDLPELPGAEEASAKAYDILDKLPPNATPKQRSDALRGVPLPSAADFFALSQKPEYKEIERERKKVAKENREKRKRLKAIKRGENINMRRDKCAGDPKVSA